MEIIESYTPSILDQGKEIQGRYYLSTEWKSPQIELPVRIVESMEVLKPSILGPIPSGVSSSVCGDFPSTDRSDLHLVSFPLSKIDGRYTYMISTLDPILIA